MTATPPTDNFTKIDALASGLIDNDLTEAEHATATGDGNIVQRASEFSRNQRVTAALRSDAICDVDAIVNAGLATFDHLATPPTRFYPSRFRSVRALQIVAAAAAIFLVFTVVRRSSLSDSKLATATTAPSKSEVSDSAVGDHPDDARSVALAVTTTTVAGETTVVPAMTASDLGPTSNAAGGAPISKKEAIVYLGSFANSDNAAAAALRQITFGATTTALSSTTTSNSASSTSAATSTAILATVTGIQCSYSGAFGPSGLVETFAATIAQRQVAVFVVRDIDPPLVTIVDADTCQPLP